MHLYKHLKYRGAKRRGEVAKPKTELAHRNSEKLHFWGLADDGKRLLKAMDVVEWLLFLCKKG